MEPQGQREDSQVKREARTGVTQQQAKGWQGSVIHQRTGSFSPSALQKSLNWSASVFPLLTSYSSLSNIRQKDPLVCKSYHVNGLDKSRPRIPNTLRVECSFEGLQDLTCPVPLLSPRSYCCCHTGLLVAGSQMLFTRPAPQDDSHLCSAPLSESAYQPIQKNNP